MTEALTHAKTVSGRSSQWSIMTTFVDDCDLDAAKALRTLVWKVVRTQFNANDPLLIISSWVSCERHGKELLRVGDCVSPQCDPFRAFVLQVGQSGTLSAPKQLLGQPCDPGAREVIGSLLFLARCKRFEIILLLHGSQDVTK